MLVTLLLLCVVGLARAVPTAPVDEITPREGEKCGYESCTEAEPNLLNVHLIAHTHDDVGWLKTVDQYYYGSRNNIQKAGVQYILDSVIKELWEDPKRKFIYVETAFFWKWWVRQPGSVKSKVHVLVRQGRLQFVGGAWSMNDEAASQYQSTIDQFTWGLKKLNDTFGPCASPRVGWQIDPFGHSREFASLLAAMGYDGLFLGRIDYQDKNHRLATKTMEMLWRGDDDLGKSSDIFTGVNFNTYSPPKHFCFDVLCDDEPIVDDINSPMYNVEEKISEFLDICTNISKSYSTNNVLVTMGEDFHYQDAAMWFRNLDMLIKYANLKAAKEGLNVKLFYSTPTCYLKAVRDANPTLPTKQDDFFPYASDPTAYWTGYFTSRPTTKWFEREGNAFLQSFKQMQVLANLPKTNMFVLNELKSAMGVMQHHDAITGTEKQHVAHDYERLLARALDDAFLVPQQALNKMAKDKSIPISYERCLYNQSQCDVSEDSDTFILTVYNPVAWKRSFVVELPVVEAHYTVYDIKGEEVKSALKSLEPIVLRIPTRQSKATHALAFISQNIPALAFKSYYIKREKVKVKRDTDQKNMYNLYSDINDYWKDIKDRAEVDIKNIENEEVYKENDYVASNQNKLDTYANKVDDYKFYDEATNANWDVLKDKPVNNYEEMKKVLDEANRKLVKDTIDAAKEKYGHTRQLVFPVLNDDEMRMLSDDPMVVKNPQEIILQNEHIKLSIDKQTGIINYTCLTEDISVAYQLSIVSYPGCAGNNSMATERSSGAYIFRPNVSSTPELMKFEITNVVQNEIVQEVTLTFNEFVSVVLGVDLNSVYLKTVVAINIDDDVGKEYSLRISTGLKTNGVFYTDSNGRQILKRIRNKRPQWNVTLQEPVPGNYYPVTTEIYVEDDDARVTLFVDRARGGSSLNDGEIEVMLHRRLLHDDAFGVDEALDETALTKPLYSADKMLLQVIPTKTKSLLNSKVLGLGFFLQPQLYIADGSQVSIEHFKAMEIENSFLKKDLPKGIHLLTVEPWDDDQMLIRFENYLDKSLSPAPITVNVNEIFTTIKIKSMKETTLAANLWLSDREQWSWNTENEFSESFNKQYGNSGQINEARESARVQDDGMNIKLKAKQIRTFIATYEVVRN